MANVRLKNIQFPGLDNTYTIPDEAPAYSTSGTYAVGDMVIYDGKLYKCTTAITTAEAWTAAHWSETKMGNEVSALKTEIDEYGFEYSQPIQSTNGVAKFNTEIAGFISDFSTEAESLTVVRSTKNFLSLKNSSGTYNGCSIKSFVDNTMLFSGTKTNESWLQSATSNTLYLPKGTFRLTVAVLEGSAEQTGTYAPIRIRVASGLMSSYMTVANETKSTTFTNDTAGKKTYEIGIARGVYTNYKVQIQISFANEDLNIVAPQRVIISYPSDIGTLSTIEGANYVFTTDGTDFSLKYPTSAKDKISDIDARVTNIEYEIDELQEDIVTTSQSYDRIVSQAKFAARAEGTAQTSPLVLLWFTDLHKNATSLKNIIAFKNKYSTSISDIVFTGDLVETYADGMTWYDNVSGSDSIIRGIGNHELFDSNYQNPYTKNDIYDRFISPYVSNWGVVQPTGASESGLCYWYKDYVTQKIRLIMLDCMYWDSAQASWLASVLDDARTNDYSVICANHYFAGDITTFKCNFTSLAYRSGTATSDDINSDAPAAVQTFIDAGGEFICWLSGHVHKDAVGVLADYPNQINIVCAGSLSIMSYNDTNRTLDIDKDTYNLIAFDPYRKIISVARIGAQYDKYLRYKGTMAISWQSKELV